MSNPTVKIKRSSTNPISSTTAQFGELVYTNISGVSNIYIGDSTATPKLIAGDGKMNTVSGAISGNLANFNSVGQVFDSGVSTSNIATLVSPTFSGAPTAPTQSAGDNSTKIATTAYVDSAVSLSVTAGNGIQKTGTAISIKADTITGVTVAPLAISSNGAGVSVDNSSIIQTSGVLSVSLVDAGTF